MKRGGHELRNITISSLVWSDRWKSE